LETVGGEKDRILARVFQALRISVNDELSALQEGLVGAEHILVHSGILVVVSFHSLEDRYVKRFFQRKEWQKISDVVRATEGELEDNSRSRSAKLRAGRKIL
jgi:16S rRNA (cytosine1402-N4)-methyltransferase